MDHEKCHVCLVKGHPAHQCIHLNNVDSDVWRDFCALTLTNTRPENYPTNKTVLGDAIVWIGDPSVIIPKVNGFKIGEDDQLARCRRQKKIEAAYMLGLGSGSVVVDAGAHFGDTVMTLAVHARVKGRSDLRFVALEPCVKKCDFLRSVVAANNLVDSVTVLNVAAGDEICVVKPAVNAKVRAARDGSLRYEYCDGDSGGGVSMITLDSIADQISPIGMLHIDVEGWESNVLRGAKKILQSVSSGDDGPPCFIIAEAWTEKESLRRGAEGDAEEKIVRVMEDEVNGEGVRRFERVGDIVDVERNLVYIYK